MTGTGPISRRVRDQLDRILSHNKDLQAFVFVDEEAVILAAEAADIRWASGQSRGPLDGVSVAVKDNIGVVNLPTTAGIGAFRDRISQRDSTVVAQLRTAGAIVLGTLNMHEGALGATTDNPFFGRCANPLALDHTPGGSSGGSAAAVAAGLVPLTLGTDTMGSVRIPAAYCGVWGLKPTAGLIGQTGLLHLSWSLDTIGLLAASPGLLAQGLDVVAGFDQYDPGSIAPPIGWSAHFEAVDGLHGVVLGRPTALDDIVLETEVADAYELALAAAEGLGATIRPIEIAGWQPGRLRRSGLLAVEAEGWHLLGDDIERNPDGFSAEFRGLLEYGRSASAAKLAGAYYRLRQTGHAARQALAGVDALIMPTAPQTAFHRDARVPVDQADLTALANAAGCPALSFPWPADAGALPAGIQLVGAAYSEARLLSLADAIRRSAET